MNFVVVTIFGGWVRVLIIVGGFEWRERRKEMCMIL